jgi:molecular chaperone Hsp33
MSDRLLRIMTGDGAVRASFASSANLVEEIRRRQQTDPTATVAVGRLATAAALMGSLLKGDQRVGLTVEGNGPLRRVQAEADANGSVRATLKHPVAGLPPRDDRFDVAGAIGHAGFLHVTKDIGLKEPYHGTVQLVSSEIAEDLAHYFTTSEQTPSSVALGVELEHNAAVAAAGGFLLQLMPEADDGVADRLIDRLTALPPTTSLLRDGASLEEIAGRLFADTPWQTLAITELQFFCSCSLAQSRQLLRTLGADELDRIIAEDGETEVTCEYCRQGYAIDGDTLRQLRAQR